MTDREFTTEEPEGDDRTRNEEGWQFRIDPGVMADLGWLDHDPAERAVSYLILASRFIEEPSTMDSGELTLLGYGIGQDKEARDAVNTLEAEQPGITDLYTQLVNADTLDVARSFDEADRAAMEYRISDELREQAREATDAELGSRSWWDTLTDNEKSDRWEELYREKLDELTEDVPAPIALQAEPRGRANREEADIVKWAMKPQGASATQRNLKTALDLGINIAGAGAVTALGITATPLASAGLAMVLGTALRALPRTAGIAAKVTPAAFKVIRRVLYGATAAQAAGAVGGQVVSAAQAMMEKPDEFEAPDANLVGAGVRTPPGEPVGEGQGSEAAASGGGTRTGTGQPGSVSPGAGTVAPNGWYPIPQSGDTAPAYEDNPYVGVGVNYRQRGRYFDPTTLRYRERPDTITVGYDTDGQPIVVPIEQAMAQYPDATMGQLNMAGTPIYRFSDIDRIIGDLTPQGLELVEDQMIRAGLIDPDAKVEGAQFVPGLKGKHLRAGVENLLAVANQEGTVWQAALGKLAKAGDEAGLHEEPETPFVARPYLPPDYQTLRQKALTAVRRELGREINSWELDVLVDGLRADYRRQYTQQVAADRALWEAQGRADETGLDVTDTGTVAQVDPDARFETRFDEMFADEIDARERWSAIQRNTGALFGSLSRMGSMVQ